MCDSVSASVSVSVSQEDCILQNGEVDFESRRVSFEQLYGDGAVTTWDAVYDEDSGLSPSPPAPLCVCVCARAFVSPPLSPLCVSLSLAAGTYRYTGLLVNGRWSGEGNGTFVATRRQSETERGQSETERGQRHGQGTAGSKETHTAKDRDAEREEEGDHQEQQTDRHGEEAAQPEPSQPAPSSATSERERGTAAAAATERETQRDTVTAPAAATEREAQRDAETAPATVGGVPVGAWERLLWWVEREHGQLLMEPRQRGTEQPEELAALRARVQELEAAIAAKQSP